MSTSTLSLRHLTCRVELPFPHVAVNEIETYSKFQMNGKNFYSNALHLLCSNGVSIPLLNKRSIQSKLVASKSGHPLPCHRTEVRHRYQSHIQHQLSCHNHKSQPPSDDRRSPFRQCQDTVWSYFWFQVLPKRMNWYFYTWFSLILLSNRIPTYYSCTAFARTSRPLSPRCPLWTHF